MSFDITKQVLAAFVRWLIAFVGVWMVKKGIIDQTTADAWGQEVAYAAGGLIVLAVPVIWKYLNARYHVLSLVRAVQTDPPADNPSEIKAAVENVKAEVKENNPLTSSV
jgi:hypothetical protein